MTPPRTKIGMAHFAGCSGCQLMLMNCETELTRLVLKVDCVEASMVTAAKNQNCRFDLLLVEGAITSAEEQRTLQNLRLRSRFLVAIGACALTGGINRFEEPSRKTALDSVYGPLASRFTLIAPQPITNFVAVDAILPGCPPERADFLDLFGALLNGTWPAPQDTPVCLECRVRENRCLLEQDQQICLGPITRGGCAARCPSLGVPCEGCRGDVPEANRDELQRLLIDTGHTDKTLKTRISRFHRGKDDNPHH